MKMGKFVWKRMIEFSAFFSFQNDSFQKFHDAASLNFYHH